MAKLIYDSLAMDSIPSSATESLVFVDVCESDSYRAEIDALARAGVIVGYGGIYRPGDDVTWAQFLTIMSRFVDGANDVVLHNIDAGDHWALDSIRVAVANGWIDDISTFDPDGYITGQDVISVAKILKTQNV